MLCLLWRSHCLWSPVLWCCTDFSFWVHTVFLCQGLGDNLHNVCAVVRQDSTQTACRWTWISEIMKNLSPMSDEGVIVYGRGTHTHKVIISSEIVNHYTLQLSGLKSSRYRRTKGNWYLDNTSQKSPFAWQSITTALMGIGSKSMVAMIQPAMVVIRAEDEEGNCKSAQPNSKQYWKKHDSLSDC